MHILDAHLAATLARRKDLGLLRALPLPPNPPLADFSSNDYLGMWSHLFLSSLLTFKRQLLHHPRPPLSGLARSPDLQEKVLAALPHHTRTPAGQPLLGSTGSRLLNGNSTEAIELESFLAKHHNAEAALLFNSGYD
ncbi:hypothetical protein BDK51DRAFT_34170, partial [Blyttiomyces helicus]